MLKKFLKKTDLTMINLISGGKKYHYILLLQFTVHKF
jgi:hypothetical protein